MVCLQPLFVLKPFGIDMLKRLNIVIVVLALGGLLVLGGIDLDVWL